MSDMRQKAPTAGAEHVPPQRGEERKPPPPTPTDWAGWVVFGAMMLILLGAFQVIAGLVALLNDGFYLVTTNGLVVHVDYSAWGWVHLAVGVVAVAAGAGLFTGRTWARVAGVCVAVLSAVVNLAFLAAFPFWALLMIGLDVVVIYAITAHGAEMKTAT